MRSTASLLLILADINAVARAAPITPSHGLQAQGEFLKDRVCTCENGEPVAGAACMKDGLNECISCNDGYMLQMIDESPGAGNACVPRPDGVAGIGSKHKHKDEVQQEMLDPSVPCNCANGIAAVGAACTYPGSNICASCDAKHVLYGKFCVMKPPPEDDDGTLPFTPGMTKKHKHKHTDETVQEQHVNKCICEGGTPATGAACTQDGTNNCVACDPGHVLDSDGDPADGKFCVLQPPAVHEPGIPYKHKHSKFSQGGAA